MQMSPLRFQGTEASPAPMDDISEASTCPSEDEAHALEPLLWVSELSFEGPSARQFTLTIGRSSTHQRFGLTFNATSDDRIVIAQDAWQFGIIKGDVVLGINGSHKLTVEKCQRILSCTLKIELSLLRIDFDEQLHRSKDTSKPLIWPIGQKSSWTTRQGRRCLDLLAVSPQQPLSDGPEDQLFTVGIRRATCNQKFGLNLRGIQNSNLKDVNGNATGKSSTSVIYCAENMPHLGLRVGDQVLSINGRKVCNVKQCCQILDASMRVELLVKRQ